MFIYKNDWEYETQEHYGNKIKLLPYDRADYHFCGECHMVYLDPITLQIISNPSHGMEGILFHVCGGKLYHGSNIMKKYHEECGWLTAGDINREAFELTSCAEGDVGIYYTSAKGLAPHDLFDSDEGEGTEGWLQAYTGRREKWLRKRLSHSCVAWVKVK